MNFEIFAKNKIEALLQVLQNEGIKVSVPVKVAYCYESELQKGSEKAKLRVYFSSKGIKSVIQGSRDTGLYKEAESVVFGERLFTNKDMGIDEPDKYIGTDESGKGDYFGPLIIAGVLVSNEYKDQLAAAGVKDSKLMSEAAVTGAAEVIKRVVKDKYSIVFISPQKYNELYEKFGNLNRLLAWGHARAIENILERHITGIAVSDKFGDEALIKNSLFEKGQTIQLHQFHKAEKYTAVAAASILARNELNTWFRIQERKFGMTLPKGASDLVDKAAVEFLKKFGVDTLRLTAKMHFKTSKKILG